MKTRKLCNDPPLKNSVQYAKNYEYCVYQDGIDILLTLESNLNYYIMVEDSTNTHDHSPPTYEPSFFHVKKIHRMLYNLYRNGNNYIGEVLPYIRALHVLPKCGAIWSYTDK